MKRIKVQGKIRECISFSRKANSLIHWKLCTSREASVGCNWKLYGQYRLRERPALRLWHSVRVQPLHLSDVTMVRPSCFAHPHKLICLCPMSDHGHVQYSSCQRFSLNGILYTVPCKERCLMSRHAYDTICKIIAALLHDVEIIQWFQMATLSSTAQLQELANSRQEVRNRTW